MLAAPASRYCIYFACEVGYFFEVSSEHIIATDHLTPDSLKTHLAMCGYDKSLLREQYGFTSDGIERSVSWAAFSQNPPDARSACLAAVGLPKPDEANAAQIEADECFVDVCSHEWDDHLEVRADVMVRKTPTGKFTIEQIRLDRRKLTARNRDLRSRADRVRGDLARVADIRQRLGAAIDTETARDLDELERSREADLGAILSPEPLED